MHNLKLSEPDKIVLIGSSTGGPGHLQKIIKALPANFPATIIIGQHIAEKFIPSFVNQLNDMSTIDVVRAKQDLKIETGRIYICNGITRIQPKFDHLVFQQSPTTAGQFNPDIDALFLSASDITVRHKVLGIILTGMG